jgi:hypothetical protein
MAEKLGVGAPEREGADPTPDGSDSGPNGSSPAAAEREVVDTDTDVGSRVEADPAVDPEVAPEPTASSTPDGSDEVATTDRSEAATRHPSMAQRLGLRPSGRLRARKVQRIVRRVDPWSVLKLSLIFYFCVWVMVIVAAVLLWGVAVGSGTVGSLESFVAEFLAFEEFRFNGDQLFQVFALGGLIGVFVATAVTAILAVLFNLIADLTGGIRFTVIEEESARRIVGRR